MSKGKTQLDRISGLTRNDLEAWAGGRIVSRGQNYQRQGRVADLAVTDDDSLIAWVEGAARYATRVTVGEDGLPESVCTCPYGSDCKHGVAVVVEYLQRLEHNRAVAKAKPDDERLLMLADEDGDYDPYAPDHGISEDLRQAINDFLKNKTKAQLIELIQDLAGQNPELARELADRQQVISGNTEALVTRLRQEIRVVGAEPGWRNSWNGEGYTPDYSGVQRKLQVLLRGGHADEVLALGRELLTIGIRQAEESHDEGETAMEIADCMPVIVEALDRSSLDPADRLTWALDAVLEDPFDLCEAFGEYLARPHPPTAWHSLADRLLARLPGLKSPRGGDDFSRNYARDRLSDWAICALEQAGREEEVIPLCIAEATETKSYDRLVIRLMAAGRTKDAEKWIKAGLRDLGEKWPGITAALREKMREISRGEKNWPVLAALLVEEFVYDPSLKAYTECRQACNRTETWEKVRAAFLSYLEKGELPWRQPDWPLPASGLDRPKADQREQFPLISTLINLAIHEKKPDQVLKWYDQRPKGPWGRLWVDEEAIATAVKAQAPERAVAIWKSQAERLIAQIKPAAYQEAVKFLKKAGEVMDKQKQQAEWDQYLGSLRQAHARKRRLMELLDGLEGKLLIKKRG
jgi:uncharacterized Zn finger protein